jgi:hypothetical protein
VNCITEIESRLRNVKKKAHKSKGTHCIKSEDQWLYSKWVSISFVAYSWAVILESFCWMKISFNLTSWVICPGITAAKTEWNLFLCMHLSTSLRARTTKCMCASHSLCSDWKLLGPCHDEFEVVLFSARRICVKLHTRHKIMEDKAQLWRIVCSVTDAVQAWRLNSGSYVTALSYHPFS